MAFTNSILQEITNQKEMSFWEFFFRTSYRHVPASDLVNLGGRILKSAWLPISCSSIFPFQTTDLKPQNLKNQSITASCFSTIRIHSTDSWLQRLKNATFPVSPPSRISFQTTKLQLHNLQNAPPIDCPLNQDTTMSFINFIVQQLAVRLFLDFDIIDIA